MKDQIHKQEGGDNSTNFQAEVVNIQYGISLTEAKAIANEVFQQNFIQLKGDAANIAIERATKITDQFLKKLEKNQHLLSNFSDPGVQDSMFNVQKEYAKSGDADLGNILVDLLMERAGSTGRTILQISLDEAIKTVPKLTTGQLDAISLNFLITKVKKDITSLKDFGIYLNDYFLVFAETAANTHFDLKHIVSQGCGILNAGSWKSLEEFMISRYPGILQKGINKENLGEVFSIPGYEKILMRCFHDPEMFQFRCLNKETREIILNQLKVGDELKNRIANLFDSSIMNKIETGTLMTKLKPEISKLITMWEKSTSRHIELTSLGTTIAVSHCRNKIDGFSNLNQWLQ